jgi:hypothetical protein
MSLRETTPVVTMRMSNPALPNGYPVKSILKSANVKEPNIADKYATRLARNVFCAKLIIPSGTSSKPKGKYLQDIQRL